jgi:hypothetical protein
VKTTEAAALLKRERELVDRCAGAAYDSWYNVTPETSRNAYCFEKSEEHKEEWRAVVRAIFREVESGT